MRDPHIIIGTYIEKRRREDKQDVELKAFHNTTGGWAASLSNIRAPNMPLHAAFGINLDAALQNLVKEIDTAKHVEIGPR